MSLAVEHSHPPRKTSVEPPRIESHAAEPLNMDAAPKPAAGRKDILAAGTQPSRSSYDSAMQRQYQDAMDAMEISTPTSDHQVVGEQAPVLPQKSALRASRMLDGLVGLKISTSTPTPANPPAFTQTPHDEYLSSEEEASSTTDDFSDFEYESSSDDLSPCPRDDGHKHEVTARVVSVVFSGKPSVVEVPQNRRSISPSSIDRLHTMTKLQHKPSDDSEVIRSRRRMSSSNASSRSSSRSVSRPIHPPRSSSMQPPSAHASRLDLPFLKIDPYANGSTYSLTTPVSDYPVREESPQSKPVEDERPKTPKSPGTMFRGVARAMTLMKRKNSSNRLSTAYLAAEEERSARSQSPAISIPEEEAQASPQEPANPSRFSLTRSQTQPESAAIPTQSPMSARPISRSSLQPVTHDEFARIAERNARMSKHLSVARTFHEEPSSESAVSPTSPLTTPMPSPLTPTKRSSTFSFGRRRMSLKLTGKLQT